MNETRASRVVISAIIGMAEAVVAVATIRVIVWVLNEPGWWLVVIAIGLGAGLSQFLRDRQPSDPETFSDPPSSWSG